MKVKKLHVKNFRILHDAEVNLSPGINESSEDATTVIVGANNSGKTSLAEVFRRFFGSATFRLEDFSNACYENFSKSFDSYSSQNYAEARDTLPFIELRLRISYDPKISNYGPLESFVIDLDPQASSAIVVIRYQLADGKLDNLYSALVGEQDKPSKTTILKAIKETISKCYTRKVWAEDPGDPTNTEEKSWSNVQDLINIEFINAQRGLDDITHKESDTIARVIEHLFIAAEGGDSSDRSVQTVDELKVAISGIEKNLNHEFNKKLDGLMPTFDSFGYPGLGSPLIETETSLEVGKLLGNNTKVHYKGHEGITLPESYNGLGTRNLLFILLRLYGYYQNYLGRGTTPGIHLIFIEEPEAHLHPQMQEVFIRNLNNIHRKFAEFDASATHWPAQFVVSTHSSHIANEAPFTAIRYFLGTNEAPRSLIRKTKVKDLSCGLGGTSSEDLKFMHRYMSLTRSDLFFADKVALIEGTAERLMLPAMIQKVDASRTSGRPLASQYVSILEVGGAFAHKFFPLLDFIEIPALVITDIDSVSPNPNGKNTRATVHMGTETSNESIKKWFDRKIIKPSELIDMSSTDPILVSASGSRRIAFQVPEQKYGPCGRTLEDSFVLANPELFGCTGNSTTELEEAAEAIAARKKKAEFALQYALNHESWVIPRYLREGLDWLLHAGEARMSVPPATLMDNTIVHLGS